PSAVALAPCRRLGLRYRRQASLDFELKCSYNVLIVGGANVHRLDVGHRGSEIASGLYKERRHRRVSVTGRPSPSLPSLTWARSAVSENQGAYAGLYVTLFRRAAVLLSVDRRASRPAEHPGHGVHRSVWRFCWAEHAALPPRVLRRALTQNT